MLLKPPALKPGDRVRVVAPAGPFPRETFEEGIRVLSSRYQPSFDPGIFSRNRYLAGDDDRRYRELWDALSDEQCRAVFCARGGYGTMRILQRIAVDALPPKLLVGFSDITALHLRWQAAGRASIHGPVMTQLGKQPPHSVERLFRLLESTSPIEPLTGGRAVVPGVVEGPLIGGNLSVLTRLLGTPYLPSLRGAILLLEDVTERPYRLDRMWHHLALAGVLDQVAGIAFGEFTACEEKDADYTSAHVLDALARDLGRPCAAGFAVGHGDINLALPLGCHARLDASAGTLEILEAAVR